MKKDRTRAALLCGMLGCLCYGGGDWLMLCADPTPAGTLSWLTEGAAAIPQWRYILSMALAFPGTALYAIGLFSVQRFIRGEREKKVYHCLNAVGLTPWMTLHLFYILILSLFAQLRQGSLPDAAVQVCQGLYASFSWLVPACEAVMLPVFLYWLYLQVTFRTAFPRWMAATHVFVDFLVLKGVSLLLPVSPFRLGFTNGLMSESMLIWFGAMLAWTGRGQADPGS